MLKVALLGIATVLLALPFKNGKSEYSIFLGIGACVFLFLYGLERVQNVLEILEEIWDGLELYGTYLTLLLKVVGITYIAEFSSDLCKDAGFQTVANQIEFVGKISILLVSMPILVSLMDSIRGFL